MKKIIAFLCIFLLTISLAGCGGEASEAAKTPPPSLAELAGRYEDGAFTFEKIHIAQEIIDAAQAAADAAAADADPDDIFDEIDVAAAGCSIEMIRALQAQEGQTKQNPFTITVDGTGGTLQFEETDAEDDVEFSEGLSFVYNPDSGAMAFDMIKEEMKLANSLQASIIEGNKIGVSGTLRLSSTDPEYPESAFYIDLKITGTKPLTGQ